MGKVVLITGSDCLLGHKLVEKELKKGNRVIAPVASKSSASNESGREDRLVIPCNRSSDDSASNHA
jgi:NAD(P)-dependent dehydrogenase (short-subunit alcohol dehydrogenase family)